MRKKTFAYAAFAASGALMALSFQPFNLWPLAWFALVPAFLALRRCEPMDAGVGGLLFGLAVELVGARWTLDLFGAGAVPIWFVVNLPWMIFFAFAREVKPWTWPILWVGLEFARAELWPWKTGWFVLGASQAPALPVLQVASLVGVFGISAMLVAANASWLMPWKPRAALLAGAVALLAAAQIPPPPDAEPLRVLLIQSEEADRRAAENEIRSSPRADLIVLPEYFYYRRIDSADIEAFGALVNSHCH